MGVAAPLFLLGALAIGLPLYLHLLRHVSSEPQQVASVMLFEARPQTARRRRRLRHLLLLLLRIGVLLLLALSFAAPYIHVSSGALGARPLLLLVIDDSFSMRAATGAGGETRLAQAKRAALEVLGASPITQSVQVLSLSAQGHVLTPVTQDRHVLRAAIESVAPGDSRGALSVLAAAVHGVAQGGQAIELHLFSDLQQSSLPAAFSEMALPEGVRLVLHPVATAEAPNWTVESVAAPRRVWDPHNTRVEALIVGHGTAQATRTVTFKVGDTVVATRSVEVPPSGRATVALDSLELPYGLSRLTVSIDGADALPEDDTYRLAIERADRKRGLFLYQTADSRSLRYFGDALEAAAARAITLDKVAVEHSGSLDPQGYAFVVISDVASLPAAFLERLQDYVRRGGAAVVVLGTVAAQQHTDPLTGTPITGQHHYARDPERFAVVGTTDSAYPAAGTPAEWEGVPFYYAAEVAETGARVAVRLQDGTPLLLEKPLGEGRAVLFTSGLDNLTNDLPLKPLFVAFIERLIRDLTGGDAHLGPQRVDDLLPLRTAREQAVGVAVTDPDGRQALSFRESATLQSYPLARAGFYEVRLASGRTDLVAVNTDRRESDLALIPAQTLALWRGGSPAGSGPDKPGAAPVAAPAQPLAEAAAPRAVPLSLWWYAMLGLLALALAESVTSGGYLGTRREDP
jgi:hypothetical protein